MISREGSPKCDTTETTGSFERRKDEALVAPASRETELDLLRGLTWQREFQDERRGDGAYLKIYLLRPYDSDYEFRTLDQHKLQVAAPLASRSCQSPTLKKAECGNTAKMRAPTSLAGSYDIRVWAKQVAAISAPLMSLGSDSEAKTHKRSILSLFLTTPNGLEFLNYEFRTLDQHKLQVAARLASRSCQSPTFKQSAATPLGGNTARDRWTASSLAGSYNNKRLGPTLFESEPAKMRKPVKDLDTVRVF
ncbi:hypothetical protein WN51_05653 [Melipona quadrifasciata]|uniref:Uncharacterized protein n=1 Tax=Melipona quadrifasciata TaxID=166423 RepID=A0A0M8ZSS4_9HYME|nr:hypothetical protein WN51_05653 [Melipona quadrifasciata]